MGFRVQVSEPRVGVLPGEREPQFCGLQPLPVLRVKSSGCRVIGEGRGQRGEGRGELGHRRRPPAGVAVQLGPRFLTHTTRSYRKETEVRTTPYPGERAGPIRYLNISLTIKFPIKLTVRVRREPAEDDRRGRGARHPEEPQRQVPVPHPRLHPTRLFTLIQ